MAKFSLKYFSSGPYKGAKIAGLKRYFGKYYWARKFYANLIKKEVSKGERILEIGCAFGDLIGLLENDFETHASDISQDALKIAAKNYQRTKFYHFKAEKTFKIEGRFQAIIAGHILEHIKNPALVLKQISEKLNENGIFLMIVPNTDSLGRQWKKEKWVGYRDKTHISLYTPSKWQKLLEKNNLKIIRGFGDGLWDSPYFPIVPDFVQKIIFSLPAVLQVISSMPFIPVNWGESVVFITRKI